MNTHDNLTFFKKGVRDGIPIALGYFIVAFTIGIAARNIGIGPISAMIISFTSLASAGEYAAFEVIKNNSPYIEMAITVLIVNLRYMLMSCALSQKFTKDTPFWHRFFVGYGITDEIFGISITKNRLNPYYNYGAISISVPGWTIGTGLGVILGNIMPTSLLSATSVALYGMFISSIIPASKSNRKIAGIVIVSMITSAAFTYLPIINKLSSSLRIILLTVVISLIAALLFPVKDVDDNKQTSH